MLLMPVIRSGAEEFQVSSFCVLQVIDKNGPAPKGTGIKQLRENIAESKLSYEIMDDAAQAFLKTKIMDNIQKYFYLICFTAYLRDMSKVAKDGVSEEEKKAFSLSGGKGESNIYFKYSCAYCETFRMMT